MISGFVGGMIIGLAAVIMMLFNGRIMGVSGILGGCFSFKDKASWRIFFIVGIILGTLMFRIAEGFYYTLDFEASWWRIVLGGLLVGYGTRLGSGCTSGHGVCGIARFSKRSILATIVFMGCGILTVMFLRWMHL